MKMLLSFICGLVVCGILLFGVKSAIPIQAQTDEPTDNLSSLSENLTQSLISLIPDIEKIYRDSLTTPFVKAGDKIYDDDIAEFYQDLIDQSVLNQP